MISCVRKNTILEIEDSSQESTQKVLRTITGRLDDVGFSNFKICKNLKKGRPLNKTDVPVYRIATAEVPEHMLFE